MRTPKQRLPTLYSTPADADGISDVLNPYTYTGRRLDDESGLLYFRARYHDPKLGRFLERDPLGYPDGLNTYAAYYALSGGLDPSGLWEITRDANKRWALAKPDSQDTISELADIIKLNADEYKDWLKPDGKHSLPETAYEAVDENCNFLIPNVVSVATGTPNPAKWIDFAHAVMMSRAYAAYKKSRKKDGYKVVDKELVDRRSINTTTQEDGIYMWAFFGHGMNGLIGVGADPLGKDLIGPMDVNKPPYHLSHVLLYACYSADKANRNVWINKFVSNKGKLQASKFYVLPAIHAWWYLPTFP